MIVFIIPLKSKQVSKDWGRVCTLLERCVQSVVNQTSEYFRVVIVCHERPDLQIDHPFIHYVEVDFSPPVLGQVNVISEMDRDKNQKMWLGMEYAGKFSPSHIMFVDADDCVSCRIAEFISQNTEANGWFLDSGYVYEDGSDRIYYKKSRFYMMSGTSHIIRYLLIHQESMNSVYKNSGDALHQHVVGLMEQRQTPLKPLPFPGAVYIIENGENIYAEKELSKFSLDLLLIRNTIFNNCRRLKRMISSRVLEEPLASEFKLAYSNSKYKS